jgi:hypothetical protein
VVIVRRDDVVIDLQWEWQVELEFYSVVIEESSLPSILLVGLVSWLLLLSFLNFCGRRAGVDM